MLCNITIITCCAVEGNRCTHTFQCGLNLCRDFVVSIPPEAQQSGCRQEIGRTMKFLQARYRVPVCWKMVVSWHVGWSDDKLGRCRQQSNG